MENAIPSLRSELDALKKALKRSEAKVVSQTNIRENTRSTVKKYFDTYRPSLFAKCRDENFLQALDIIMQQLLEYCNARTLLKKYIAIIKKAGIQLNELESICFAATTRATGDGEVVMTSQESAIIKTLDDFCPNAAKSYRQGLQDLKNTQRFSWRGTVAEFREALRETLDKLAPDDNVKAKPDFKFEKNQIQPTMKQKVVFILKNRQVGSATLDTAKSQIDLIEEKTGLFVRSVYRLSSVSTHGEATLNDVKSIRDYVSLIMFELLEIPRH